MCQLLTELEKHVHAVHYRLGYEDSELLSLCHDLALRVDLEHLPEKCIEVLGRAVIGDPIEDDTPI